MLRKNWLAAVALIFCAGSVADAAGLFSWSRWKFSLVDNNRWPEQHLDVDRSAARAPFSAMIANGWRSQTTLSDYHFLDESGELNDTGKLKVNSILFDAPIEFRTIYVLRGDTQEATAGRLRSVQEYASFAMQGEPSPPIMVTTIEPRGTRGDVNNTVNKLYIENAPTPKLPPPTQNGSSSSGS